MHNWKPADEAPEGIPVMTKIDDADGDRNHAPLMRVGRLWFVPDGSMHVYYTPTHYRGLNYRDAVGKL